VAEGRAQAAPAWIVDLRFAYVPSDKWKLNVQVSNVFNTEFMTRPADLRPPRAFQIQAVRRL
jgi:outer membrane receptor protein involved in Fe transport